ncbi:hypothetical protein BGW80DRAFT_1251801 [Lactifluus volemus]|nr:hypothetical protein BGW80DRAFT_1251801 [Lactifluus volemus]
MSIEHNVYGDIEGWVLKLRGVRLEVAYRHRGESDDHKGIVYQVIRYNKGCKNWYYRHSCGRVTVRSSHRITATIQVITMVKSAGVDLRGFRRWAGNYEWKVVNSSQSFTSLSHGDTQSGKMVRLPLEWFATETPSYNRPAIFAPRQTGFSEARHGSVPAPLRLSIGGNKVCGVGNQIGGVEGETPCAKATEGPN